MLLEFAGTKTFALALQSGPFCCQIQFKLIIRKLQPFITFEIIYIALKFTEKLSNQIVMNHKEFPTL